MLTYIERGNRCSILATTPKISEDTSNREKPFFGFFSRIDLPSFSHRDAIEMLAKIAELSSNTKLTRFLTTQVGSSRVRAIHHLAGGNPRVYALFAQLITAESLESLLPAAMEMLDKLTPYYQSRVESLGQSDDQQKIVMHLVRENRAFTVKEITKGCFISTESVASNALKKLKQKGYVISEQQGREVFYDLSEVLMRLCLQMKSVRNGNLKLCIDFLKIWFSAAELRTRHDRALAGGKLDEAKYYQQALDSYSLEPIVSACLKDTNNYLHLGDGKSALGVWQELVSVREIEITDARRVEKLIETGEFDRALTEIKSILAGEEKPNVEELDIEGLLLMMQEKWQEALVTFDRAIEFKPDNDSACHNKGIALCKWGKYTESISAYDRAIQIKPDKYDSWHDRGLVYFQLNNYTEALTSWQQAFKIIQELKPDNTSDLIQELFDEQLLAKFQQPAVAAIMPALFEIYRSAGVLSELGVALVRNLKQLQSPMMSEYTADRWLEMWQQLGGKEQELQLSLKLLAAGIEYKKNPNDRRIFLRLPLEMRSILQEAVSPTS